MKSKISISFTLNQNVAIQKEWCCKRKKIFLHLILHKYSDSYIHSNMEKDLECLETAVCNFLGLAWWECVLG